MFWHLFHGRALWCHLALYVGKFIWSGMLEWLSVDVWMLGSLVEFHIFVAYHFFFIPKKELLEQSMTNHFMWLKATDSIHWNWQLSSWMHTIAKSPNEGVGLPNSRLMTWLQWRPNLVVEQLCGLQICFRSLWMTLSLLMGGHNNFPFLNPSLSKI